MLRGRLFHVPPFLMFAEEPIHFTLLMPFKLNRSWDGGKRVLGAADLTVKMVNTNREVLLGRQFEYHWEDSGCIAPQGLAAMGKPLGGLHKVDAVIGPACSAACQVTSCLSSGQLNPRSAGDALQAAGQIKRNSAWWGFPLCLHVQCKRIHANMYRMNAPPGALQSAATSPNSGT